jgi:hypothetical protein
MVMVMLSGCAATDPGTVASTQTPLTAAECAAYVVDGSTEICHRTASTTHPFTFLRLSESGCINGHSGHARDYVTSSDPTSPLYDPTCSGGGCFPEGGPCDASTLSCCDGLSCIGGVCSCPGGSTFCLDAAPDTCVDLGSDSANCGACGNACGAGKECVAGQCVCDLQSCPDGCCSASGACETLSASACQTATGACAVGSCDDGNDCTYGDHCDGHGSCGGTAIVCQSDDCHTRTCNGTATCSVTDITTVECVGYLDPNLRAAIIEQSTHIDPVTGAATVTITLATIVTYPYFVTPTTWTPPAGWSVSSYEALSLVTCPRTVNGDVTCGQFLQATLAAVSSCGLHDSVTTAAFDYSCAPGAADCSRINPAIASGSVAMTLNSENLCGDSGVYGDAVLEAHPLAYYRLDELDGDTAFDSSGNVNDGTYFAVALGHASVTPLLGFAAGFNFSRVDLPVLGSHAQLSVEAWIKPTSPRGPTQIETIFADGDSEASGGVFFGTSGDKLIFNLADSTGVHSIYSSTAVPLDTWTHVAATFDSTTGTANLYINRALDATATLPSGTAANLGTAYIGATGTGGAAGKGYVFFGDIDEVAIYDHVLSLIDFEKHFDYAQ